MYAHILILTAPSDHTLFVCAWPQVVRIDETSDVTFNALMEFGKAMKKVTVSCKVCVIALDYSTLRNCALRLVFIM